MNLSASIVITTAILLYTGILLVRQVRQQQVLSVLESRGIDLQQPSTTQPSIQKPHTVLLIRGHSVVGNSVLARVARYARACARAKPAIDVWLGLDTSRTTGQQQIAERYFQKVGVVVHLDTFNDTDVFDRFPSLRGAFVKETPGTRELYYKHASLTQKLFCRGGNCHSSAWWM
eukprot:m.341749 g.341749  ORF g.341749 m.341749 type:complete len:174 (-) comp20613_c0_seq1:976-1497(-)